MLLANPIFIRKQLLYVSLQFKMYCMTLVMQQTMHFFMTIVGSLAIDYSKPNQNSRFCVGLLVVVGAIDGTHILDLV